MKCRHSAYSFSIFVAKKTNSGVVIIMSTFALRSFVEKNCVQKGSI